MKKLGNEIKEKILPFFTLCFRKVKLFAEKRFLFFTLATNIAFFISMVALYLKWHTIPWTLAIGFPMEMSRNVQSGNTQNLKSMVI